jgi:NDP-sugar pyrophosphorylase family protein
MTTASPPVAILTGGLATRLMPLTDKIPKALVPVAGRPFLALQLELLARQEFRHVVLCVGHLGEQIEAAFGDGRDHGVKLEYSHDGDRPVGTASALRQALPKLGEVFLVLYGDSYLEIDYRPVVTAFDRCGKPALMTVMENSNGAEPGNVRFDQGNILAYDKRNPAPHLRHIDYGLGVYRASVFRDQVPEITDLSELQSRLAREGLLAGHEVTRPYFEIGSYRGLLALESHLQGRSRSTQP